MAPALLTFAVQSGLSIGGVPAAVCGRTAPSVVGRMTASAALGRLLAASHCGFLFVDAGAVRLTPAAPRSSAAPAPTPTPAPPRASHTIQRPSPPGFLDEVVVRVGKRASLASSAPYSVTSLSADYLTPSGTRGLNDLAGAVAGLTLTNLGAGRDKIFIRGLSDGSFTGHTQSTVGLYLDDVPITYDAPDPDLMLADVDQVEVLRGPQGTLYGAGSIGGIVRIVTRRPQLDSFSGSLSVGGGGTAHGDPSSLVEGVVNVPLVQGKVAIRAVGYREILGGYIDDLGLGVKDVNATSRSGGRLSILAAPTDDWTIIGGLAVQSINAKDTQYAQSNLGPLQRRKRIREPHDNDFNHVFATVEHHGGAADVKASVAYVDHDFSSQYDATQAFFRLNPVPTAPVAFLEKQRIELLVAEANLISNSTGRLRWLAGAFVSDTDEEDAGLASPYPNGVVIYNSGRTDRLIEAALYGEVSYLLTPSLTVTGGLRWFGSRLATTSAAEAPEADRASGFTGTMTNHGVAPKAVISYGRPDRLVYAQVAQGYRSGGFNGEQLFTGVGATTGPAALPRAFRPDELWSYEVGGRVGLFEKRLQLSAALFHADWYDLQSDQYFSSGLPVTVNIGDGSNTGVELEAVWRSRGPLSGRVALLLDDPQLTRARPSFPAQPDHGLPGVARVSGGVSATYAFNMPFALHGALTAGVDYVGRSYLTFDRGGAARMGGFGLVNMSASLSRDAWKLSLIGENLTDETGNTFSYGNPFSRPLVSQITPPRPQNFTLVLTRTF